MLELETRLRVAQGFGKNETEASLEAFEKRRAQGQSKPPALVSDGWGGVREALIEVYGEVPPYKGRGRPPTKKQGSSNWQYLQLVNRRDAKGRLLAITPKAIFGAEQTLLDRFGAHTAYIERTHLTMRNDNRRLCRKTLAFSKSLPLHRAAAIWDDVTYNLCKPLKSLRLDRNPQAKRFEKRFQHRTPAMAAGLTNAIWSIERLLRTVPIPNNS